MLARRHLLLLTVLVALSGSAALAQLATFPTAELTIVSASGPHKFTVELATTPYFKKFFDHPDVQYAKDSKE